MMKDKNSAGLLALFLGGFGGHKFYLEQTGLGVLYLLFCWTFVPALISIVEAIILFSMSREAFDRKYNAAYMAVFASSPPQSIVVNVTSSASASVDIGEKLAALHNLKVMGAITDEEFTTQKQRLLSGTSS
jgi:TM2 domain-containing membrane protein YozV